MRKKIYARKSKQTYLESLKPQKPQTNTQAFKEANSSKQTILIF